MIENKKYWIYTCINYIIIYHYNITNNVDE